MIWFEQEYNIKGCPARIIGTFDDSELEINAIIKVKGTFNSKFIESKMYSKTINMWAYQEVLAEDISLKYQGIIKKCEKKLSSLIEEYNINESI